MSDMGTTAVVTFDGTEITDEQKADIKEILYIDNDEEHADDLQIITGREELLDGVSEIGLLLRSDNWHGTNTRRTLDCGMFAVDDRASRVLLKRHIAKASAVTPDSEIRQTPRYQAWECLNLKEIATEIAWRNNADLIYAAELNPVFARKEQINQSDIKFLSDLCRIVGMRLKYTENSLVVYDPYEYRQNKPVRTFINGDDDLLDIELHHKKDDTDYAQCRVIYKDPVTKELISYTYKKRETGRRLDIRCKVSGTEEAAMLAELKIKEKNRMEYTGYILCNGDISLATGSIITLFGYGEYDRNYMITKTLHRIQMGVYSTKIYFEMAEGYE